MDPCEKYRALCQCLCMCMLIIKPPLITTWSFHMQILWTVINWDKREQASPIELNGDFVVIYRSYMRCRCTQVYDMIILIARLLIECAAHVWVFVHMHISCGANTFWSSCAHVQHVERIASKGRAYNMHACFYASCAGPSQRFGRGEVWNVNHNNVLGGTDFCYILQFSTSKIQRNVFSTWTTRISHAERMHSHTHFHMLFALERTDHMRFARRVLDHCAHAGRTHFALGPHAFHTQNALYLASDGYCTQPAKFVRRHTFKCPRTYFSL